MKDKINFLKKQQEFRGNTLFLLNFINFFSKIRLI
jgi:hypothetical protein